MITQFDGSMDYISQLPNEPNDTDGMSADELKAEFDRAGQEIKEYINNTLISELSATTGADEIGASIPGTAVATVAAAITYILQEMQSISQGGVADEAVTTAKIAALAVTAAKIAANAVTTEKLAAGAVTQAKIAQGAVGNVHIEDNAVSTGKVRDLAIAAAKIADAAIGTAKIADNAVNAAKIAAMAVTSSKINDGAVTGGKIADGAVTFGKCNFTSGFAKLGSDSYGTQLPAAGNPGRIFFLKL